MGVANWIDIGRMDELGRIDSPVHHIDARAKALVTILFICIVMSLPTHEISMLTPFLLYPITLLALGRIPMSYILQKLLVAAPFALVVGIFNPIMDRHILFHIGPVNITSGWISFASILFRFVLTVGAALALIACTGMYQLSAGLLKLGIPRVFVMQLLFLYRYLFVIGDEADRMKRGASLRLSGRRLELPIYASLVGHLLLRSVDRAQRIYQAMLARGFDGTIRVAGETRWHLADTVFVVGWGTFFVVSRHWNLPNELGQLVVGGHP